MDSSDDDVTVRSSTDHSPSLARLSGPLILSFWMRAAFTFVDTIYASLLGDDAIAAIGLTVPFEFLMIALWVGLSTGVTSGLSRAMGARESCKIAQYVACAWKLTWLCSPLFVLVGAGIWLGAQDLGLDAGVARNFQIYGTVLIGGSALTTFWSILPDSLVKAHFDTRSTMWAGIWSNVINLVLNTLFLFVFEWGIFGIALSTVLGRIGGLAYALIRARQHEMRRKAKWGDTRSTALDPAPYRTILGLAVPSSLTFGLMAVETALVNGLLANMKRATEAIAAYSIYYRIVLFALQPVIAIAVATLPYAARRLGQGDGAGVRRGFREAVLGSTVYSVVIVGPLMLFGAPYIADGLAESPVTSRYATFALWTVPLSCLTGALFIICRPVFEAFNRGRPGLAMAGLRYLVLTAPLAWAGMRIAARFGHPGLYGLIFGLIAAGGLTSGIFYLWLRAALPVMLREGLAVGTTRYGAAPHAESEEPAS